MVVMISVSDLINKMLELFPDAVIEEDANGEIVVYTALKADGKDNLVKVVEEEEN